MLFSILRDSIVLFLLIYAVVDLGNHLINWLTRRLTEEETGKTGFYLMDMTGQTASCAEFSIRTAARHENTVLLITDPQEAEIAAITKRLCRELEYVHTVTRAELIDWLKSETSPDAFLKGDKAASQDPDK